MFFIQELGNTERGEGGFGSTGYTTEVIKNKEWCVFPTGLFNVFMYFFAFILFKAWIVLPDVILVTLDLPFSIF